MVSVATTPVFDTRLVVDTLSDTNPYPNMALSRPYPAAAGYCLAVPTPVVSVATTPVFDTRLVIDTTALLELDPYPNMALSPP